MVAPAAYVASFIFLMIFFVLVFSFFSLYTLMLPLPLSKIAPSLFKNKMLNILNTKTVFIDVRPDYISFGSFFF